ncbi:MAG: hypothetical protein HYZ16_04410 [Bacteroidetes bacterium]|nr:hypothetical protein [Bacteroidota bacterium]
MRKINPNVILFIVMLTAYLLLKYATPSNNCRAHNQFVNSSFEGVVEDKYRDRNAHLYPTIKLTNDRRRFVFHSIEKSAFYDFVEQGDSLLKEKGSMDVRLIRSNIDTVITIDYGCEQKDKKHVHE